MKRIAIIEDNADNRLLAKAILGELYEVDEYETGPEGLKGMRDARPHLLLLDISLPGMDGTEVVRHIRLDPDLKALPIIALTAHAMAGDRERFLSAGFDDYIAKPILDESVLLLAIDRLLRSS